MLNKEMSAGTNAEQSKKDETRLPSSPTSGNTNVVRSPKQIVVLKKNEMLIESNNKRIKVSDRVLFVTNVAQINIPICNLFNFLNGIIEKGNKEGHTFILSE